MILPILNKVLTSMQKTSINDEIQHTTCFDFPGKPNFYEPPSGFNQLRYMTGYVDLTERYGRYADKLAFDLADIAGRPLDNKGTKLKYPPTIDAVIDYADNVIEASIAQEITALKQEHCVISLQKEVDSLNISEDMRDTIFYMMESADFHGGSPYIKKRESDSKQVCDYECSAFAPFAHILLSLMPQAKRTDANRELHSAYFLGSLLFTEKTGLCIDFSQHFTISDYWYYEMETGVNLSVELADALLTLLKEKVITSEDISCICSGIKQCLWRITPYPILIRNQLLRRCTQYMASYMEIVRQHPRSYLTRYGVLKSPVKDNDCGVMTCSAVDFSKTIKFTGNDLAWVFSEILQTLEVPSCQYSDTAPLTDDEFATAVELPKIYEGHLFTEASQPKRALTFCNPSHPFIREYIDYINSGLGYRKNLYIEKMFYQIHSILFEDLDITGPRDCNSPIS